VIKDEILGPKIFKGASEILKRVRSINRQVIAYKGKETIVTSLRSSLAQLRVDL
jgi:hypothetical protein